MSEKPCFNCGRLHAFEEGEEQLCPSCKELQPKQEAVGYPKTPLWSYLLTGIIGLAFFTPFILMILSVVV